MNENFYLEYYLSANGSPEKMYDIFSDLHMFTHQLSNIKPNGESTFKIKDIEEYVVYYPLLDNDGAISGLHTIKRNLLDFRENDMEIRSTNIEKGNTAAIREQSRYSSAQDLIKYYQKVYRGRYACIRRGQQLSGVYRGNLVTFSAFKSFAILRNNLNFCGTRRPMPEELPREIESRNYFFELSAWGPGDDSSKCRILGKFTSLYGKHLTFNKTDYFNFYYPREHFTNSYW